MNVSLYTKWPHTIPLLGQDALIVVELTRDEPHLTEVVIGRKDDTKRIEDAA